MTVVQSNKKSQENIVHETNTHDHTGCKTIYEKTPYGIHNCIRANVGHSEALAVHNAGSGILEVFLGDPHGLEGGQ